jgi:DNA-binding Xre family transcriptional regulator
LNIEYTIPMIQWRLRQTLEQHHITRYALQKHTGIAMNTLRDMYDGKTQRPDLGVLGQVVQAIQTGCNSNLRGGESNTTKVFKRK